MEQFCTKNTKRLFSTLGLSQTLLAMDPSELDEEETFQGALRIINGIAVVNDRAERGVALIQEFNKKLTSAIPPSSCFRPSAQISGLQQKELDGCSMCLRMRVPGHHYIYRPISIST